MIPKEEIPSFYKKCRLAVMSSVWYEGFPTVLPELMSLRKPVIVQISEGCRR